MKDQIALFLLHERVFALTVEEIQIILQEPRIHSLPLLPPEVAGMLMHGGEAIPLLKSGRLFAGTADDSRFSPFVVVCSTEFGAAGLPADKVLHIVDRSKGRLADTRDDGLEPTFEYAQVRYPLLDIGRIFAELSLWDFRHPPPQGTRRFE